MLGCPEKKKKGKKKKKRGRGERAGLSVNKLRINRQQKLLSWQRAEEDLTALIWCPLIFYSHAHAASLPGFVFESSAVCIFFFFKLHIHPTFAFVITGGKGRKKVWLLGLCYP